MWLPGPHAAAGCSGLAYSLAAWPDINLNFTCIMYLKLGRVCSVVQLQEELSIPGAQIVSFMSFDRTEERRWRGHLNPEQSHTS